MYPYLQVSVSVPIYVAVFCTTSHHLVVDCVSKTPTHFTINITAQLELKSSSYY